MPTVACPHCRSKLENAGSLSGQAVACPSCGGHFVMPSPVLPVAQPTRAPAINARPTAARRSTRRNATAEQIVGTGCLILGLIPIVLFVVSYATATPNRVYVSRSEFGNRWPLTVDSGEIECIDGFVLVFHHGGKTYQLNGAATARGYPAINPIWRDDPSIPGTKISIAPLIKRGLTLGASERK